MGCNKFCQLGINEKLLSCKQFIECKSFNNLNPIKINAFDNITSIITNDGEVFYIGEVNKSTFFF